MFTWANMIAINQSNVIQTNTHTQSASKLTKNNVIEKTDKNLNKHVIRSRYIRRDTKKHL